MRVTYEFTVTAECPNDGDMIELAITVAVEDDIIQVEEMVAIAAELERKPIYQEDFTRRFAESLPAKQFSLVTVGTHRGVTITCSA